MTKYLVTVSWGIGGTYGPRTKETLFVELEYMNSIDEILYQIEQQNRYSDLSTSTGLRNGDPAIDFMMEVKR